MNKQSKYIMNGCALIIIGLFLFNLASSVLSNKFVPLANVKFVIGILAISLPLYFHKTILKRLSNVSMTLYFLFIFFTLYLGETYGFYYKWEHFDSLLHLYSGGLIALISYEILSPYFNKEKISQWLLLLTTSTLSMTIGVFWEFYEYIFDGLMDLNMQRYMGLAGRDVLYDTIKDMACNLIGITIVIVFIMIRNKKNKEKELIEL